VNHNEPDSGALVCRSANSINIRWHFADGAEIKQHRIANILEDEHVRPYLIRVHRQTNDSNIPPVGSDGLWSCRVGGALSGAIYVGVYRRGGMFILHNYSDH
jgi:hypothetical protein